MAEYKGKYILQSDSTYTVELYEDNTLKETITNVFDVNEAKAIIIPWFAQKGYTDMSVNSSNFTPDMDNFDSLYVKSS
tara:strand:+ start:1175 stop:1408 length:234 start_codon:yes stop_codon:yes gene_type:complete